jgi:hypothetical protein
MTAKMVTLTDAFPGTTLNTSNWTSTGTVTVDDGVLTITDVADEVEYNGIKSAAAYDLTSSQFAVNLLSTGTAESTTSAAISCSNNASTDQLTLMVLDGHLEAQTNVGGTYTVLESATYNATTMAWIRIREASGTTYFEYASTFGGTWTTLASVADPFTETSLYAFIQQGQYGGADPQTSSQWASVNPSSSSVVTVTNPGSQTFTAGTAYSLTVSATDSESLAMVYTATGLPPGLALVPSGLTLTGTGGSASLSGSGGAATVSVSFTTAELSEAFTSWAIAGTPTSTATGTYTVTLTATDTAGNVGSATFTMAPLITTSRSQYTWPFTWNSIWNMPIASTATYAATGITSTYDYSTEAYAVENNSVNPSFPVKTFSNSHDGSISVYCDPNMTGAGVWNDTCAFLRTDGDSVAQGQTLELTAGGNPSLGGAGDYTVADVSITTSTGIPGAHGGSSLSCLGGTLTKADLTGTGPIAHAMKVLFNGLMYYSSAGAGYQWPASNADGGYNVPGNVNYYGGSNTHIVEGALLALPPSINPLTRYSDPLIRRIATAMQCYGCYIVDNTASGAGNATSVVEMNYDAAPYFNGTTAFTSNLLLMYSDLQVVTNSSSSTPGGGTIGTSRYAPYAPEFTNGTGAPPTGLVVVSP